MLQSNWSLFWGKRQIVLEKNHRKLYRYGKWRCWKQFNGKTVKLKTTTVTFKWMCFNFSWIRVAVGPFGSTLITCTVPLDHYHLYNQPYGDNRYPFPKRVYLLSVFHPCKLRHCLYNRKVSPAKQNAPVSTIYLLRDLFTSNGWDKISTTSMFTRDEKRETTKHKFVYTSLYSSDRDVKNTYGPAESSNVIVCSRSFEDVRNVLPSASKRTWT